MSKNPIVISKNDILSANAIELNNIIKILEKSLVDYKHGDILLPEKISQVFDEKTQNRINCMPATLKKENVCGVKWVSVFPNNPSTYGVPNVSGLIILSELVTGYPFAILEGAYITAVRTAALGALAASKLANANSRVYCTIGTGEQAKMHFSFIKQLFPSIDTCKIASKTESEEQEFINYFKELYPDVDFISCKTDCELASKEADIIVTAVSCQAPLLKAHAIKQGAFYCHVGGYEDEYAVPLKANKIICDSWDAVKHRTQTISKMYKEGMIKDSDIYADIVDILDGTLKGRENESEFIYFNSVGLAFIDIAVANEVFRKVKEENLGKEIDLWG